MTSPNPSSVAQPVAQRQQVDLLETGLLWLINTTVFHPRGFSLGYAAETGQFELLGDGTEAWVFSDETAQEKFRAVSELLEGAGRSRSGLAKRALDLSREVERHSDLVAELRRQNEGLVRQVDRLRSGEGAQS